MSEDDCRYCESTIGHDRECPKSRQRIRTDGGTSHGVQGLVYSEDGTLHLMPRNPEVWVDSHLGERRASVCGGNFPANGTLLDVNGLRLSDEYRKGFLCDECLDWLLEEDVTIPGFIVDGELVGEAARYQDRTCG